jgi:general stress protein YciG
MTIENETSASINELNTDTQRRDGAAEPAVEPAPKAKRPRGFAMMDRERNREVASSGGKAAHAYGLANRFTSDKAREAGKKGGASTSRNREHMAEIGRKGGFAKRGQRRTEPEDVVTDEVVTDAAATDAAADVRSGVQALRNDGESASDMPQVVASPQLEQPSLVEVTPPPQRRPPSRGQRKGR